MATINKDFKLKNGLIVEGSNATVNGYAILTKSTSDQNYIIGLIGGSATAEATPDTVVLRDNAGSFAANEITANTFYGSLDGTVSSLSNHDTGDLSEGSNLYFTSDRVKDILTNSTQSNIVIETIGGVLHITAENGVADSTTDDLAEGTSNKYFTNQRAIDAGDGVFDAYGAAATAQGNAEDYADSLAGNYDPAGSASSAYSDAVSAAALDASSKADAAESAANLYTDGEITTALSTAQGYADTAEANANAYTDNAVAGLTWKQSVNLLSSTNLDISGSLVGAVVDGHSAFTTANNGYRILLTGQSTASENGIYELLADGAVLNASRPADANSYDELVGAAVYVMEGTQFGATSWVQGNHYLSSFTGQSWTQFSGQGSVTAGSGITVDGLEVSVNRTTVDTWYDATGSASDALSSANSYTDSEIITALSTAQGYADTAEGNANDYTDTAISNLNLSTTYDAYGAAATAEQNAKNYADGLAGNYDAAGTANTLINALTTDDIEEGTFNHYYTDGRAKDAAADLLTNATLTNITITGTGSGLTITAENGVADSTTDDLEEGSTNLYFTGGRVLDTIEGADILPGTVSINTFRKEEATRQTIASASTATVHSFSYPYESAKYVVRVVGWDGGTKHSQITEILMTVDGNNNIAITEYGTVHTSTNSLATFSAEYTGGQFGLTATTAVAGCEVIVAATMLSWLD
jgi:hypothetical protein